MSSEKKISKPCLDKMMAYYNSDPSLIKLDYENVLKQVSVSGEDVFVHKIEYYAWTEIDDEAMVSSCVPPNGKLLVVDNGSYGARLAKIASVYNIDMDVFKSSTYEPIDIAKLEEQFKSKKYTTFAMVHHETTTGLLNHVEEICPLAKKYGMTTIVDTVSSYGGMPIDLEKMGIDFTIYPGKLGNIDTFRIANMGDIKPAEMEKFVVVLEEYMHSIGVC